MPSGRATNRAGYAQLTEQLARQALSVAADAAPHRAREGERRWPMAEALPAARVLIGCDDDRDRHAIRIAADALQAVIADPAGKVTDGFGHSRPVYAWLALHLLGTAARLCQSEVLIDRVVQAVAQAMLRPVDPDAFDPRLQAWADLIAQQNGFPIEQLPVQQAPHDGSAQPLVPLGVNDLIDAWTYRELLGLHALHLCAEFEDAPQIRGRVESAALYHLGHTQPDYTTYQPWALAAFASDPGTALFAEQQLHDVATHLRLEGPGGAVLPALLLADAAATLSGTVTGAWASS